MYTYKEGVTRVEIIDTHNSLIDLLNLSYERGGNLILKLIIFLKANLAKSIEIFHLFKKN